MKASDVLRKAAEDISNQMNYDDANGCCDAIEHAFGGWHEYPDAKYRAYEDLRDLFENEEAYWFGLPWTEDNTRVNTEAQNHRIIALLLTADMAESVGD